MPSIINNTKQNHEVYLVCRQHENELPAGDCNVVRTEVTDSYATEGNTKFENYNSRIVKLVR